MSGGSAGNSSMPKAFVGSLPSVCLIMADSSWLMSKSKQLGRIIDQHQLARAFIRRDLGDQVDQVAVIGHGVVVRVRPVGAPDHALGRMRGEIARESYRIGIGIFLLADAIRAGEL